MITQAGDGQQGEIRIDKEGNWFFNGAPIIHQKILELFNAGIEHDGLDGYQLHVGAEIIPIIVEDTPFVVTHIDLERGSDEKSFFMLRLGDGTREQLCWDSFYLGADNIPYCTVKQGRFPARFLRAPYYDLARHIEQEGEDRFCIMLNGIKQYILHR